MNKQDLYDELLSHFGLPPSDKVASVDQLLKIMRVHHHVHAYNHYMEGVPEILAHYVDDQQAQRCTIRSPRSVIVIYYTEGCKIHSAITRPYEIHDGKVMVMFRDTLREVEEGHYEQRNNNAMVINSKNKVLTLFKQPAKIRHRL